MYEDDGVNDEIIAWIFCIIKWGVTLGITVVVCYFILAAVPVVIFAIVVGMLLAKK